MKNSFLVLAMAAVAVTGLGPSRASAHGLQARVTLPPDAVVVAAWFTDDTPAQNAQVVIVDAAGNEVATGQTDERGFCTLPKLPGGSYTAIVELIGHRDEVPFIVAATGDGVEFSNWHLNKTVGLTGGVIGLLLASSAYWLLRRGKLKHDIRL
jgi:hypothetical protein